ncbi:hypothetical protein Maes01_01161 [Microbulbifer aestuariivivens]|uniref:LysM domain-containing protein n=1 Tax=Microbulbifer aestuariivivens TaxID=1908308 RepID=A0ABP9WNK2_9GAMM
MRKIILVAALLVAAIGLHAQDDIRLNPDHPDEYVVEKGDTLWDISGRFLTQPWYWPEIWQVNPQVENPHLIYPGDRLRLVYVAGQPQLQLERGPQAYKLTPVADASRLSPQVRREAIDDAIPALPLDAINAFLSHTRIVDTDAFEGTPYVISGDEQRILMGAGEKIYVRGDFRNALSSYGIYRPGEVYRDPNTGEVLGLQALDVGNVDLYQLDPDRRRDSAIATMRVTRTAREIRLEDRLLPAEERAIEAFFQPSAPPQLVYGQIIGVEEGVTQIGKFDVVAINRGLREGISTGNVLAIYKRGATVRDRIGRDEVKLPDERAGLMMVFRTFDKMSLGLVLEADRPLELMDQVRNP